MFVEKPPILSGNLAQDNGAIRDYLVRLARSLERMPTEAGLVQAVTNKLTGKDGSGGSGESLIVDEDAREAIDRVRSQAAQLRDLIIKTAYEVEEYADRKVEEYGSLYVAKSEFGTFRENISTEIETTARGVVESYDYQSEINSVQDDIGLIQNYMTAINGEIRRGIIEDPETGNYELGIAISQSLQFTGEVTTGDDGYTYYYLNTGQTFGLYTSTGWQFWIDGYKMGWFDSEDSYLHVHYVVAEQGLQVGDEWQIITSADGGLFEIKYIGV